MRNGKQYTIHQLYALCFWNNWGRCMKLTCKLLL